MSNGHAKLSASSAHRWMPCPGSVALSEGLPNNGSLAAATGTLAHSIAAAVLEGRGPAADFLDKEDVIDGFTVRCDEEMVDGVNFYIEECIADAQIDNQTWIEMPLLDALSKLHPDFGGTADFVRWSPSTGNLRVIDLKYGAGKFVSVQENKQALMYALGALLATGVKARSVTCTIVQPRIDHPEGRVRNWTFAAIEVLGYAADFVDAANAANQPNAPLVPGDEQCSFCPVARARKCPALEQYRVKVLASDFAVGQPYDPAKLAEGLAMIPLLSKQITAMEEFAYHEAVRGVAIPGYKLVDKRANRSWRNEEEAEAFLLAHSIEPRHPGKLLSPAQAEKKLSKAERAALDAQVERVSSGRALVPDTDPRPAANLLSANDFTATDGAAEKSNTAVLSLF